MGDVARQPEQPSTSLRSGTVAAPCQTGRGHTRNHSQCAQRAARKREDQADQQGTKPRKHTPAQCGMAGHHHDHIPVEIGQVAAHHRGHRHEKAQRADPKPGQTADAQNQPPRSADPAFPADMP
jgi:hypothetical protein